MIAHSTLPSPSDPLAIPGMAIQPEHPDHHGLAAAGSIIALHVGATGCPCPSCTLAQGYASALARLAAYLEAEGPTLARVLSLLDLRGGLTDLEALQTLHVEPGLEAVALADAALHLDALLDDLAEVPTRAQPQIPMGVADRALVRDLDAAVRWLGARTQDVREVVRHALS